MQQLSILYQKVMETVNLMDSLVVFSFFEKTTYCCRARRLSVCPSVRPSVCPSVRLSVRPSVVCGNNFFSR